MATVPIINYVFDAEGNGVSGATVQLYALNVNGTLGSQVGADYTTGSSGRYSFSPSDSLSPSGMFVTKVTSGSDVRWYFPDIRLQAEMISGPNGTAPLPSNSVLSSHLAAGAANDAAIGGRTLNQAISSPATPSGSMELTTLASWLAKALKNATGETNWYTAPTKGALVDKVRNGGNAPRISAGPTRPTTGSETGEIFVCTSGANTGVWYWSGSSWTEVANPESGDSGSPAPTSNGFATVRVGATNIVADSAEDTLNLVAGTGISLSPVAGTDTITISATGGSSGGGTGGGDATTLKGIDGNRYPYFTGFSAGSPNPPNLGATSLKMEAGSVILGPTGGGLFTGIDLVGPVTGYITILAQDGDYDAHPGFGLVVTPETSITGSNPAVVVRAVRADTGAAYTAGQIRVNYIVVYW